MVKMSSDGGRRPPHIAQQKGGPVPAPERDGEGNRQVLFYFGWTVPARSVVVRLQDVRLQLALSILEGVRPF